MSSLNRFLSASAASWSRVALTLVTQILLVPIFLGHWTVEEYGCWLIIQTLTTISSLLSTGHQNFVGYEFLKVGDGRSKDLRLLFYSALPFVIFIAILELLILLLFIHVGYIGNLFDPTRVMGKEIMQQAVWSLVIYSFYSLLGSSGGLASRAVAPYGHFARMAWWTTFLAIGQALTSAVVVALGANLLETVICIVVAGIVANIPIHLDMWRLFQRYGLTPVRPDLSVGRRNFWYSLAISLSSILDISRQQGVRVFLGAIVGVTQMTAFSTMRTMSNLSLQGIGTITNPIMPEIMRFLRERDAERTNATVGFIWFSTVLLLAPVLVIFQWLMPMIFHIWTRGKIEFDPALFGLFSIALLIFSIARPAVAVLQGNNLLKVQLWISILVSLIAVCGILSITHAFGLVGAAMALLLAELAGTVLAVYFAAKWLDENGLQYPWQLFGMALTSIGVTTAAILLMLYVPGATLPTMAASVAASALLALAFLRRLPEVAVTRMRGLGKKFIMALRR